MNNKNYDTQLITESKTKNATILTYSEKRIDEIKKKASLFQIEIEEPKLISLNLITDASKSFIVDLEKLANVSTIQFDSSKDESFIKKYQYCDGFAHAVRYRRDNVAELCEFLKDDILVSNWEETFDRNSITVKENFKISVREKVSDGTNNGFIRFYKTLDLGDYIIKTDKGEILVEREETFNLNYLEA